MPAITVNGQSYQYGEETAHALSKVPQVVNVPWVVDMSHVVAAMSCLVGTKLIPKMSLNSHKDVYYTFMLSKEFGLFDKLCDHFLNWTSHESWGTMYRSEYLPLLENLCPILVDWKVFFAKYTGNIKHFVRKVYELEELRAKPDLWVKAMIFIRNFDFNTCFDEVNDDTCSIVKKFQQQLKSEDCARLFMINPYEPWLKDYFVYTPSSDEVWKCDGISVMRKYSIGEPVLVSHETFIERFNTFSEGRTKDIGNCFYAGGAISKLIGANYDPKFDNQSDLDLFITGTNYDERKHNIEMAAKKLVSSANGNNVYYAYKGSVVTTYIVGSKRKYQLISNDKSSMYSTLSRFDTSYIQWAFDGLNLYGTPEALLAIREQLARITCMQRFRLERVIKALYRGYDIIKNDDIINNKFDITELIKQNPKTDSDLSKCIRSFYGNYYPTHDESIDPDTLRYQHMSGIERDNAGFAVTDNIDSVFEKLLIGGNFDNSYDSNMFNTFNIQLMTNNGIRRGYRIERINSTLGTVKLLSDVSTVKSCDFADGFTVTTDVSEAFKGFLDMLNGPVFTKVAPGAKLDVLLGTNNTIKYSCDGNTVRNMERIGKSLLVTQNGKQLNINEDICPGDRVQVLFEISVAINRQCSIELIPKRFIKQVTEQEVPVSVVEGEVVHDEEIKYEE